MTADKLYRLMDLLDELKNVDQILSVHEKNNNSASEIMLSQYKAKKEKLLVYFINEINASMDVDYTPQRLIIIKKIMERFYSSPIHSEKQIKKHDEKLDRISDALSA
jgi:hypothetical protein